VRTVVGGTPLLRLMCENPLENSDAGAGGRRDHLRLAGDLRYLDTLLTGRL
jgi:hypothetical protein